MIIAGLWVWRERTERQRLQVMVKQRTQRILKDKELIESQAEKLKELDAAKSTLFTNISHEFRTPLTIIQGMSDLVETDPRAPQLIKNNSTYLLNLIDQILDLRKLEHGSLSIEPIQSDIVPFISSLCDGFELFFITEGTSFPVQFRIRVLDYGF